MKIFSIKDLKSELGANPMVGETTAAGIRYFAAAIRDPENPWSKWPEDFVLFELGDWNPERLEITTYDTPRPVSRGDEWTTKPALQAVKEKE